MVRKFIELGYEDVPGFRQAIFENNDSHGGIHMPTWIPPCRSSTTVPAVGLLVTTSSMPARYCWPGSTSWT